MSASNRRHIHSIVRHLEELCGVPRSVTEPILDWADGKPQSALELPESGTGTPCCEAHRNEGIERRSMIVCSNCGDKRCPRVRDCGDLCQKVRCPIKHHHQPCDCEGAAGDR